MFSEGDEFTVRFPSSSMPGQSTPERARVVSVATFSRKQEVNVQIVRAPGQSAGYSPRFGDRFHFIAETGASTAPPVAEWRARAGTTEFAGPWRRGLETRVLLFNDDLTPRPYYDAIRVIRVLPSQARPFFVRVLTGPYKDRYYWAFQRPDFTTNTRAWTATDENGRALFLSVLEKDSVLAAQRAAKETRLANDPNNRDELYDHPVDLS